MVGRMRKDGQPDMRFKCNQETATGCLHSPKNYGYDFNPPGPLRKDGQPDMRNAANRKYVDEYNAKIQATIPVRNAKATDSPVPLRKDGQPDMRHKCNRERAGSVVPKSDTTTRSFCSPDYYGDDCNPPGPLRKDGRPDMRYTANKEWVAEQSVVIPARITNSSSSRKDVQLDMGLNRNKIEKEFIPPGPLRDDGQPDMRYSVNKKWVAERGAGKIVAANKEKETNAVMGNVKFGLINARSLSSKSGELEDEITNSKLDIVAITETWFKDDFDLKEACPEGFKGVHQPREGRRGGGVAIFHRDDIKLTRHSLVDYKSFEYLDVSLDFGFGKDIRLLNIYRAPGNIKVEFLEEFATLLRASVGGKRTPLITGDFNLHLENPDSNDRAFLKLIKSHGLVQHVNKPTHEEGGILDLIITRLTDSLVKNVRVSNDYFSNHKVVKCTLSIEKEEIFEREE